MPRDQQKQKSQADQSSRTTSIASRIHWNYWLRSLLGILILDLFILGFTFCLSLLNIEQIYLEEAWQWKLDRSFSLDDKEWAESETAETSEISEMSEETEAPENPETIEPSEAIDTPEVIEPSETFTTVDALDTPKPSPSSKTPDEDELENSKLASKEKKRRSLKERQSEKNLLFINLQDLILRLNYHFALPQENTDTATSVPLAERGFKVSLAEPLTSISKGMGVLLVFEFFYLASYAIRGWNRTRRSLYPLQQMAEKAEDLSEMSMDLDRYHDLEHAIEEFKPTSPEDRLSTGDQELKGLETAINNLLLKMHNSYRQQSRFVSDASHELRTPIAVIQGYADMLARWGAKDEAVLQESIEAIQEESKQMQVLVEQLLFLARGDTGRQALTFEALDLSELVQDVVDEYSMIDDEHHWVVETPEPCELQGDRSMLKQVIRILADNARKYSPADTTISLSTTNEDDHIIFSIQDEGAGIPEEDLPKIFDRFYRADPARSKQTGGTGLGLSIADWIVDQHDGHFRVLSREGLGTRFRIIFPKVNKRLAILEAAQASEEKSAETKPAKAKSAKTKSNETQ